MSYLLTEIALEMLGYKFYDTNGVFHLTDFQQTTPQSDLHLEEKTLQTLLLGVASEDDQDEKSSQDNLSQKIVAKPTNKQLASKVITLLGPPPEPTQKPQTTLLNLRNKECNKIRKEYRNRIYKKVRKAFNEKFLSTKVRIRSCLLSEPKRIEEDMETMQSLRAIVERRMEKIDATKYEQYLSSFGEKQDAKDGE